MTEKLEKRTDGINISEAPVGFTRPCTPPIAPPAAKQANPAAVPHDLRADLSYRNGLIAGFGFGINGDEDGYAIALNGYCREIHEARIALATGVIEPTDFSFMAKRCLELEEDLAEQAALLEEASGQRDFLDKQQSDECFRREKAEVERDTLRAEVEALRKDTARLDWLIQETAVVHELIGQAGPRYCVYWPDIDEEQMSVHETPRAAIDAAMEASK